MCLGLNAICFSVIDETATYLGVRSYVTASQMLSGDKMAYLRPYHLNWKPEAGFKGYVDPAGAPASSLYFDL